MDTGVGVGATIGAATIFSTTAGAATLPAGAGAGVGCPAALGAVPTEDSTALLPPQPMMRV